MAGAMNGRQHALYARSLIERSGGLAEAAGVCRVSKSVLSAYQTPDSGAFMPMDVVADLEAYCGDPLYSRAVMETRPCGGRGELLADACQGAEDAIALQALVRRLAAKNRLSPNECDEARKLLARVVEDAGRVRDDLDVVGCAR